MARRKIGLIGAGNIGGELAQQVVARQLGDVVLFDIPQKRKLAEGKALDLLQCSALDGSDGKVIGTSDWQDVADADVLVITAGIPRKPGQSRDDLIRTNLPIIRDVADQAKQYCPGAFVVVISNPLDAMVHEFQKRSGFTAKRVVGMAGVLDSARLALFLAQALGTSTKDVRAMVLGGHGDDMVPLLSTCTVNGVSVRQLLAEDVLAQIVQRTRHGGGEIVELMGTSAHYAPAVSAISMVEAYLLDQKRLLPCAARVDGEYGVSGLYLGVPVIIGAGGVERIVSLSLDAQERQMFAGSVASVRKTVDLVEQQGD